MKKLLAGCLIVLVVACVGFAAAAYYAYRAMRPVIDNATTYMEKAQEVARLGEEITNKAAFMPPEAGELTQEQVERFVAVQTRVRAELGDRWGEIEEKSAEIKGKADANRKDWTLAEFTSVFSDIANIWVEARKAQVKALNVQKFSDEEYQWVRMRVYEAAGVQMAGSLDLSKIEQMAGSQGVSVPKMQLPDVPKKNVALVQPHLANIKQWMPMAALGL
jgi:hypothetical protein